jgi:hypothetical protein
VTVIGLRHGFRYALSNRKFETVTAPETKSISWIRTF